MTKIKIDFTYHRVLLGTAEAQLDEYQHPIAIVTAQMAVEVRIDEALRKLLGTYPELPTEALMNVLPDRTLMQRSMRELWKALTGDSIKDARAWKEYHHHVERRNRLVHGGEQWSSSDDAEASLKAVRNMISHLDEVEKRVLAKRRPGH
jgi:HEPN domain-containing protein